MDTAVSTPMLKQYHSIKAKHKDCILFFRLGDFYEMFFEDAKVVSRELDLVLTARGKNTAQKTPMCGFPHHAAAGYIAKLIKNGHKIAICEQTEDPSQAKGLVKRDVTRIITSGTYLDEQKDTSRVIIALSPNGDSVGLAFTDPTNGTIQANQYPLKRKDLIDLIANLPVYECLYPEQMQGQIKHLFNDPLLRSRNVVLSPFADWCFSGDLAQKTLCEHFSVHNLRGFGIEELPLAVSSAGALLEYLKQMNKQPLRHIDRISLYTDEAHVFISPAAHHGLEMDVMIKTLDHTTTALGRRTFRSWLLHPLKDVELIHQRQKAVSLLIDHPSVHKDIRGLFKQIPDIEKNISRISCGYTHARDLLALRNTLSLAPEIMERAEPLASENGLFKLEDLPKLREFLCRAVNEDIPLSHPEGKIIRKGFHKELDELRGIQENGRQWLKRLQEEEIKRTGINSLKIGYNKVFGYYIEVTKTNLKQVPDDYIRKQTLVNAERFITPELKEYEEKILTAQDKILKIENELVQEIQNRVLDDSPSLHELCQSIATIDVLSSFATLGQSPNYTLPVVSHDTLIDIKEGRHPVVELTAAEDFVPNDTHLDCDQNHLIILTGPNMAGKSTYIRQTAVLVIMAQAGMFIPAASAHIGVVDKVFTRIGAHDDISKGQSTFMVEMNETADILNNLTDRSLVILDEIGRGTSTFDGLSLAWALAEHLKSTKARTLFATHFHELTALAEKHSGVKNFNVAVKEWEDEIIFLHKIIEGSSDDSYGIYVAKLAGIPEDIIRRARHILTELELKGDLKEDLKTKSSPEDQLNLFTGGTDPVMEEIKAAIEAMDINNLTPVEALIELQKLKETMSTRDT